MNRDELDKRNTAAITHWWVTMRDTGKVAPGLLDDLWDNACKFAAEQVAQHANPAPIVVAAKPEAVEVATGQFDTSQPLEPLSVDEIVNPAHRTRTRTRRNTG